MSLKLRTNDLTWHGGFHFLLRADDQQPMTLDITRGVDERYSLFVHNDCISTSGDRLPCGATPCIDGIVIEKLGCLITILRIMRTFDMTHIPTIETARKTRLMVA